MYKKKQFWVYKKNYDQLELYLVLKIKLQNLRTILNHFLFQLIKNRKVIMYKKSHSIKS